MSERQIKDLHELISKGPLSIVDNYFKLLDAIDTMTTMAKMSNLDIANAAGISESQLYRRKNKPELWTKEELTLLLTKLSTTIEKKIGSFEAVATTEELAKLKDKLVSVGRFQLSDELRVKQFLRDNGGRLTSTQVQEALTSTKDRQSAIEVLKGLAKSLSIKHENSSGLSL